MTPSFLNMNHRDAICEERQHEKTPWMIITAPKGATFLNITGVNKQKRLSRTWCQGVKKRLGTLKEIKYLSFRSGKGQLETFVKKKNEWNSQNNFKILISINLQISYHFSYLFSCLKNLKKIFVSIMYFFLTFKILTYCWHKFFLIVWNHKKKQPTNAPWLKSQSSPQRHY